MVVQYAIRTFIFVLIGSLVTLVVVEGLGGVLNDKVYRTVVLAILGGIAGHYIAEQLSIVFGRWGTQEDFDRVVQDALDEESD